jgi:hypothetical protein
MGRKRKVEGVPPEIQPPARHVTPLRHPGDVSRERQRLYRLVLNGKITVEEGAKLSYILTSIRADLEADLPPDIALAPGGYVVDTVNIIGVPSGTFLTKEEVEASLSQFAPEPPPSGSITRALPMLKVYESAEEDEEPLPAA